MAENLVTPSSTDVAERSVGPDYVKGSDSSYRAKSSYARRGNKSQYIAAQAEGVSRIFALFTVKFCNIALMLIVLSFWGHYVAVYIADRTLSNPAPDLGRTATVVNSSEVVVMSSNVYCNNIIRRLLIDSVPVAAAGRAMLHCIYMTQPHEASPLAYNFFSTFKSSSRTGVFIETTSGFSDNLQDIQEAYELYPELRERGVHSISVNNYIDFLSAVRVAAGSDNFKEMELLRSTMEYDEVPISGALSDALRRHRWEICSSNMKHTYCEAGNGEVKSEGHSLNQRDLMQSLTDELEICFLYLDECRITKKRFMQKTKDLFDNEDQIGRLFQTGAVPPILKSKEYTKSASDKVDAYAVDLEDHADYKPDMTYQDFVEQLYVEESLPGYLIENEKNTPAHFLIIDKDKNVAMGGSAYCSEFGSMVMSKGMIYDNGMKNYNWNPNPKARELKPTFLPLIAANNQTFTVTLLSALRSSVVQQGTLNVYTSILHYPYTIAIRRPIVVYDKKKDKIVFSEGTPYTNVIDTVEVKRLHNFMFEQVSWTSLGLQIFGAKVEDGRIEGHLLHTDGLLHQSGQL